MFTSGYYNEAAQFCKQAKDMGLKSQIIGEEGFDSPKSIEIAGKEAAGVPVEFYCNSVYPTMGSVPAYKAIAIAVMGGLGNVRRTVIASLILGLVETFLVTSPLAFILPRDSIAFVALILVLLFRPHGLFGRR